MAFAARWLAYAWELFAETAPFILFGLVCVGVLHELIPERLVRRHAGAGRVAGPFWTAFFGVPLPLCSCSVLPFAAGLRRAGAGRGATLSFLIATPQTGVDSALVAYSFFGWPFALFKVAAAFVTGVIGGLLAGFLPGEAEEAAKVKDAAASSETLSGECCCSSIPSDAAATPAACETNSTPPAFAGESSSLPDRGAKKPVEQSCCHAPSAAHEADKKFAAVAASNSAGADTSGACRDSHKHTAAPKERRNFGGRLTGMLAYGFGRVLGDIAFWLVVGILLAGLVRALVPAGGLTGGLSPEWLYYPAVLAASVPLYVCSTSSVPLAFVMVGAGVPAGAALVFLMAGPATNAATIGVVGKTLGKRAAALYLAVICGGSILAGIIFDDLVSPTAGGLSRPARGLAPAIKTTAGIVLAVLCLRLFMLKLLARRRAGGGQTPAADGV